MAWPARYGSSVSNYRDSPVGVSPWAQVPKGRAATEPRHGGAARRSLRSRRRFQGRMMEDTEQGISRGGRVCLMNVGLEAPGRGLAVSGRGESGTEPPASPRSFPQSGIGCADDPGGQPFNRVGAVRRSASGKANQVSPLTPEVAATGSSLTSLSGWTRVSTFRSSLFPRAARAHLRSRFEPQVRGVADVASVTTSCSPGVSWTDADLRHPSRPQAQDSFIAATITSAEKSRPDCLVISPGNPVWQLPFEPQGRGGRRRSPANGAPPDGR